MMSVLGVLKKRGRRTGWGLCAVGNQKGICNSQKRESIIRGEGFFTREKVFFTREKGFLHEGERVSSRGKRFLHEGERFSSRGKGFLHEEERVSS